MTNAADNWSIAEHVAQDGCVRSFMKNLSPRCAPGDEAHALLAWLTLRYQGRSEVGLPIPGSEEAELVFEASDVIGTHFESDRSAVHAAEVLGDGVKDFLFYVRDAGAFAIKIEELMKRFSSLRPVCQMGLDPSWSQYAELPGPEAG